MRRQTVTVLLTAWLTVSATAEIPDRLENPKDPTGPPVWISEADVKAEMVARAAPAGSRVESVGHIFRYWPTITNLLESYSTAATPQSHSVKRGFKIGPDGNLESCDPWVLSYQRDQAANVRQLAELSKAIVSVRVVDSRPGFLADGAGELLELEVLGILKDELETVPTDGFYIFDLYARMLIDGQPLCLGRRQVPHATEFMLFMAYAEPFSQAPLPLFHLDSSALVAADGSFYGHLLDEEAPKDEIARQLADLIGSGQR